MQFSWVRRAWVSSFDQNEEIHASVLKRFVINSTFLISKLLFKEWPRLISIRYCEFYSYLTEQRFYQIFGCHVSSLHSFPQLSQYYFAVVRIGLHEKRLLRSAKSGLKCPRIDENLKIIERSRTELEFKASEEVERRSTTTLNFRDHIFYTYTAVE